RIVIPDLPHHVTQRGNNHQDVFFTDRDRLEYLRLLREQAEQFALNVLGYCLMTNHVHLIATPREEDSLARALGRTHFLYTQYVNRLHGRAGHLWQNRFFSCAMQEAHAWRALRYVERNPVRARMVRVAWRFPWSSAAAHVGEPDPTGLLDLAVWNKQWRPAAWREALRDSDDPDETKRLLLSTHRGRPLGTDSFLSKLESKLNRRMRPLPVGRPKRTSPARRHGEGASPG
ncbi:MAG: transposase, partial [Gemmatimonadota bacterium]